MFPPVSKQVVLVNGASVASNATQTAILDTLGHDFVSIGVAFGTVSATNGEQTLKIGEADVTNTSSFTDITALVGGGTGGFTIPTPAPTNTSAKNVVQFDIDLRHRKRYLLLSVCPYTTKTISAWASLGQPETGTGSDSNLGRVST